HVIVVPFGRAIDAEVREQLARVARVFAEDDVRAFERVNCARRKVAKVAERRADDEEFAGHECGSVTPAFSPAGPAISSPRASCASRLRCCAGALSPPSSYRPRLSAKPRTS